MSNNHPIISIRNVSKTFHPTVQGVWRHLLRSANFKPVNALNNISLDIHCGEIFGLVGRNGQGKTTLIRCISSLLLPTSGSISICGLDTYAESEKVRAKVGLVLADERTFYGRLTGIQNLMFFARLYGLNDRNGRRRICELAELFDFTDLIKRRFQELSSGNKQRMSLIRALLIDPSVILLDEPTRSLDPIAADELRRIIFEELNAKQGKTIIITSHNLNEIETLCSRVGFLSGGEIKLCATMEELSRRFFCLERVNLSVSGIMEFTSLPMCDMPIHSFEWKIESSGRALVSFQRKANDDILNTVIRKIQSQGGSIMGCCTERDGLREIMSIIEKKEN